MPLTSQPSAYNDCYAIWDAAIASRTGARAPCTDLAQAQYLRMRLNHARQLQRDLSRRAYDRSSPAWNTSEYDRLKVVLKQDTSDNWWVYVEPWGDWSAVAAMEPIDEDEAVALPPMETETPKPMALAPSDEDNLE